MVNVVITEFDDSFPSKTSKALFCFGTGKIFQKFIRANRHIDVAGIIDNYLGEKTKSIKIDERTYPIVTLEEYIKQFHMESSVIITAMSYEMIIDDLDAVDRLEKMDCYLVPSLIGLDKGSLKYDRLLKWANKHNCGIREKDYFTARNKTEDIKRFQIWHCSQSGVTAGSKAPKDFMQIAGRIGYQRIDIHPWVRHDGVSAIPWSVEQYRKDWGKCLDIIENGSIVLLQHPLNHYFAYEPCWEIHEVREQVLRRLKCERNVKIISLVHDVEDLREIYVTESTKREFQFMMEVADIYIVHSSRMKEYFINQGVDAKKILVLGIFDYLSECEVPPKKFQRSVIIAGNLNPEKGRFIEHLGEIQDVKFYLFGDGYDKSFRMNNVEYYGSFHMEDIISALHGGFGLVWNGDSMDSCDGAIGRYLRYNSPHKLSLYLAAGLPVIVWKEAAIADFVREHNVGIAVESLKELSSLLHEMTEEKYNEYIRNIMPISKMLRNGVYTKEIIEKAEKFLLK